MVLEIKFVTLTPNEKYLRNLTGKIFVFRFKLKYKYEFLGQTIIWKSF